MSFTLLNKIMERNWLKNYQKKMRRNGLKIPLSTWFSMAIGGSLAASLSGFFVFELIGLDNPLFLSAILFLVAIDLSIGYPIYLEMKRLDAIEKALPNALKQISDTLRAGGTYEFALRELVSSELGPLTKEIKNVLRKLDEGENMENSFKSLAKENDSKLLRRSVTIIIDTLKTGAALSEVLEQISEDVRELRRIGLERKSRTIMGVMLIIAAGAIVAPALFGLNGSVLEYLINTAIKTNIAEITKQTMGLTTSIPEALAAQAFLSFILVYYIFLELVVGSMIVGLMRDGKASKSIIYAPILLLIGFIVYYSVRLVASTTILAGV